jgi:hypothetical protein
MINQKRSGRPLDVPKGRTMKTLKNKFLLGLAALLAAGGLMFSDIGTGVAMARGGIAGALAVVSGQANDARFRSAKHFDRLSNFQ